MLTGRLEQFIHKMMSQAENSSGTKEEQMARKQEILEELQRVEQELKFRTQMAQLENQPLSSLDSQEDSPVPPPPASLSSSPPSFLPPHEYVMNELQQKQMAIQEQQQHERKLQQQKEFYQAKLQVCVCKLRYVAVFIHVDSGCFIMVTSSGTEAAVSAEAASVTAAKAAIDIRVSQ